MAPEDVKPAGFDGPNDLKEDYIDGLLIRNAVTAAALISPNQQLTIGRIHIFPPLIVNECH
jgi:hypothetical protein